MFTTRLLVPGRVPSNLLPSLLPPTLTLSLRFCGSTPLMETFMFINVLQTVGTDGGGLTVRIGDAPPSLPTNGDLWWIVKLEDCLSSMMMVTLSGLMLPLNLGFWCSLVCSPSNLRKVTSNTGNNTLNVYSGGTWVSTVAASTVLPH